MFRFVFALLLVVACMFTCVETSEAACGRCGLRNGRPRVLRVLRVFRPRMMQATARCNSGSCR